MKSKKVKDIIRKIESISGERNFSKKEVLNFIKIAEMEIKNDENLDEFFNEVINSYKTYDEMYYILYENF